MSKVIKIREARMEDLEQVQALVNKLWDRDPKIKDAFPQWMRSDWIPEAFPSWIEDDMNHPLVAVDVHANKIVGVVNAEIIDQGETLWLEGIRIDPDYQRHGIGRMLTEELLKWGQRLPSIKQFRLVAMSTNKASLSLTRSLGFRDANYLNGYNIPLTELSDEARELHFQLSRDVLDMWEVASEEDVDRIHQWFKDRWTALTGHPTIGLGGLYLAIKRENIEYLMSGWKTLVKKAPNGNIEGILLLRGSRTRTEDSIPSRAILCVPPQLTGEAILVSYQQVISTIEPHTTDLRILGRFLEDNDLKTVLPPTVSSSLLTFSPVLMEKEKKIQNIQN